jgi:ElaB/YqjD/DUF883 family membrane-anchored ribosome-binding protein
VLRHVGLFIHETTEEEIMTLKKDAAGEPIDNEKTLDHRKLQARSEASPRTYRSVLIAASVGVLIGLLLKR